MDTLTSEDKEFLAKCEEELKHRYTENDEEFMKVFNTEPSVPPIIDSWVPQNAGRRNDRRHNRRGQPYERQGNKDRNFDRRDNYDRRDNHERRGYNDYDRGSQDRGYGGYNRNQRPRYY